MFGELKGIDSRDAMGAIRWRLLPILLSVAEYLNLSQALRHGGRENNPRKQNTAQHGHERSERNERGVAVFAVPEIWYR